MAQIEIPEKPELQTSIYDYAGMLSDPDEITLGKKLIRYSDATSAQIVIVTLDSLAGENIRELTARWGNKWGVGQADKDNGVMILLAQQEHKLWISPGYGVEDTLTSDFLGQMIEEVIIPEFKIGNFFIGLDKGTDAIILRLKGK